MSVHGLRNLVGAVPRARRRARRARPDAATVNRAAARPLRAVARRRRRGAGAGREGDHAADEHRPRGADRQADPDRQEGRLHQLRRRGLRDPGRHHQAGRRRPRLDRRDDRHRRFARAAPERVRDGASPGRRRGDPQRRQPRRGRQADREGRAAGRGVRDVLQHRGRGRRDPQERRRQGEQRRIGENLAAKIVADSNGKANTLFVNISAFQILQALAGQLESSYKQFCPDCEYGTLDIPVTSLGKDAPDRIVSYLRSHPQVNYVVLSVSNALGAGLPAALKAAGLADKVKLVGQSGDTQTFQDMAGRQHRVRRPVRLLRGRLPDARRAGPALRGRSRWSRRSRRCGS